MTTIATDGYTVASDSLVVEGYTRVSSFTKVWRHDGYVYACSGALVPITRFIEAQKQGKEVEFADGVNVSLIRVRNGKVWFSDDGITWLKARVPYSLGSGGALALGAMAAGASPRSAVQIAMKYDVNTGGRIKELSVYE